MEEKDLDIRRDNPSLAWLVGGLIPIVIGVGRALAVVGALITGFACLGKTGPPIDWPYYAVAGATFSAVALACRRG